MILKRGWFGPKRFGWGASPASWEGWTATGVFIFALLVTGNVFREEPWIWMAMGGQLVIYFAIVVLTYDENARTHL